MRQASPPHPTKAVRQAAIWSARLRTRKISVATLRAFFDWKRQPENGAAFARLMGRNSG
jgi:ferric-dicitrate binding protein FerR (iron transport regulator)